jgi:hypothetical protein
MGLQSSKPRAGRMHHARCAKRAENDKRLRHAVSRPTRLPAVFGGAALPTFETIRKTCDIAP